VKAVGVSNYNERRLRDAYEKLKKRGIPLASNQVNYSLIYRAPEENGVKAVCDELGISLIAYSPIAQGVLTGKYTPENPPAGPRRQIYTPEFLTRLQPLLNRMIEIGEGYSKTPTQVCFYSLKNTYLIISSVITIEAPIFVASSLNEQEQI
jgi:aryl-alcohol dehydrogenase-like predicted oxidoreductase